VAVDPGPALIISTLHAGGSDVAQIQMHWNWSLSRAASVHGQAVGIVRATPHAHSKAALAVWALRSSAFAVVYARRGSRCLLLPGGRVALAQTQGPCVWRLPRASIFGLCPRASVRHSARYHRHHPDCRPRVKCFLVSWRGLENTKFHIAVHNPLASRSVDHRSRSMSDD
jgi:hypothetical protein